MTIHPEALKASKSLMKPGEGWGFNLRFPGYFIGMHGQVMSCIKRTPKILSPIKMGLYDGYQLRSESGEIVKVYRHRLIAETFIGPCPEGQQCRHKDGTKTNADISNLEWGTAKENSADKLRHGTHTEGDIHPASKLSRKAVLEMRKMRENGDYFHQIAKRFGVSTMTAHRAATGTSWRSANGTD